MWMADVSLGEAAASCLGFYGAAFDAVGKSVLAHSHGGAFHLWTNAEVDGSNPGGREWTRAPRAPGTSRTSRARRGIRAAGGCSRDRAT